MSEGYRVVGFDVEAHDYGTGGYPGKLILRDVRSIHGSELKDAAVIVASPPCQAYSYRAMPWKRAKALPPPDNTLFNECFRIQREACEAAGHYIPLIVENVRGAQPWVGRARWNYGSFYLWGDVPALMPMMRRTKQKTVGPASAEQAEKFNCHINEMRDALKWGGCPGERFDDRPKGNIAMHREGSSVGIRASFDSAGQLERVPGVKSSQSGDAWFDGKPRDKMLGDLGPAAFSSGSLSRKAASAMIAKIPEPLSRHIARTYYPKGGVYCG